MNPAQFEALAAQNYNRIPVARTILADLDTPLSAFLKLCDEPYAYLLESVQGGEKWGRYSIIGLPAATQVRVFGHRVEVTTGGEVTEAAEVEDPLAWIESFKQRFRVAPIEGLPKFTGGLVGYFGYDTVRYVEPKLGEAPAPDPLATPDILLLLSDEVVVFDNLSGKLHVIVHVDPTAGGSLDLAHFRIDELEGRLRRATPQPAGGGGGPVEEADFVSGFTQEGFEAAVERVKEYIYAGDCMQVVLSQRLSIPYRSAPLDLYRALRTLNPSPYMFYFDFDRFQVVGSSPEILTRVEEGVITVRPIAGTRPRGTTPEEDRALEQSLLADPKERAEHLMLIDLGRNDVGRVSEIGSVEVTEQMVVERYSHVMHIVSNVQGRLDPEMSAIDALRATFPAGTVSGAPKIRAMEIIDELEPVKRGIYAGAVGYIGWNDNMDTAIAIRTAVIQEGVLHIQAGAGIVADSVPRSEWEETMNKGRAIFRAVAMAQAGLDRLGRE
ncbi:MAG: anthranilate synthase component I [Gammaproteobacteria bacterium]